MFDWTSFYHAGIAMLAFALAGWLLSLFKRDVSIVDSMWSLMILLAGLVFYFSHDGPGSRAGLVLLLLALWAIRLSAHITWSHYGKEEDYRYQRIRANNGPHFEWKSIYIVFGLQAALGWVVALPILAAVNSEGGLGLLDYLGLGLWLFGMFWESIGDWQLRQFKLRPDSKGQVLDSGLWRYTRHPNYFGECCIWWGFFAFALSAGGWWAVLSPLLMTFLLLKVSGVAMLEQGIGERRPKYADYMRQTNAFIPWLPKLK